jgi:hypothetical protein
MSGDTARTRAEDQLPDDSLTEANGGVSYIGRVGKYVQRPENHSGFVDVVQNLGDRIQDGVVDAGRTVLNWVR